MIIMFISLGLILCVLAFFFIKRSLKLGNGNSDTTKNRSSIVKEAEKKLKQDPRNPKGLIPFADMYYEEKQWAKALDTYKTIIEVAPLYPGVDLKHASFRAGICALETNDFQEALRIFSMAKKDHPDTFESNFYLGQTYYKLDNIDNAISLLNKAFMLNRENQQIHEYLGLAYFKKHDYKNAIPHLKAAFDFTPDNKYLVFAMAESLLNCGKADKALNIFLHLRADPEQGAISCLHAGNIYCKIKQKEKAQKVFEFGLKHTAAAPEIITSLKYNLAQTYLGANQIPQALVYLREIQAVNPKYKDTTNLIKQFEEMSLNANLQTYLIAGSTNFVAFCRQLVSSFYKEAYVKIVALDAKQDLVEIQAEIETAKWEDFVIFRFYRSTGLTGDFAIREFHGRIRDAKAGKGVFVTAGTFSAETKKFVEGRPIDLIDKTELLKLFERLERKK